VLEEEPRRVAPGFAGRAHSTQLLRASVRQTAVDPTDARY
jgi:hypothetical protein